MEAKTLAPRPTKRHRQKEDASFKAWLERQARQDDDGLATDEETSELARPNMSVAEPSPLTVTPREYQNELYERAKMKNTIVVLETGNALLVRYWRSTNTG